MKTNKYLSMAMMTAGLFAAASCTDFDDYNKVTADANASAGQTLWENIKGNSQLSDFASLVQKAGFDDELSQTQYYTVWAPLNGTFSAAEFQGMDNNALVRQFVKNHIAPYAHSASGKINERILMLNEKSYNFTGSSPYTFDEVTLHDTNLPNSNGLLHTLDGVATFYPNLYEFVTDEKLAAGKELDSLRQFFLKYETTYLDTEKSVVGSIVNGMQTYVDSVMVTENTLWESLNGKINNEDSTYTFLMPTNQAWAKTYDRIKGYFNYLPTTQAQFFNDKAIANVNTTIDNAYQQDSLTNRYLTRYLIYSNNDGYNQWIERNASALGSDTMRTTTRGKLSNPADILAQTKEKLKMSNGVARIVDSLAFLPWETYAPEHIYAPTNRSVQGRVMTGYAQRVDVENPDPAKVDMTEMKRLYGDGTFSYLYVEPNSGSTKPELDVYLPDVRSTTYDFYCVFVPRNVELGDTTVQLPNRCVFELNYCDANGKLQNYVFKNETDENKQWLNNYYEECKAAVLANDPTVKFTSGPDAKTITAFSNDVTKVDTLYLGEFTFPVSYYGLRNNDDYVCPNLKITSPFSSFNKALMLGFERSLRIAAIILKPKELVEFENK
jgi:uncharacterized surface protein with fasciclin (FAS1) repeats